MILRRYQWVLGFVWLAVAGLVAFRESLLPVAVTERMRQGNEWLVAMMAVVFAMWNFARWYAFANRNTKAYRSPLRMRQGDVTDPSGGNPNTSTS